MSERSQVWLWDRSNRELVAAELIDEVSLEEVIIAAGSWQPLIDARANELARRNVPRNLWPQHIHWDWKFKAEHVAGLLAYQILGIECQGAMQGLMLVATEGKACRLPVQQSRPLVYIHFLATAPWNDTDFMADPKFGGVGKVFMAAAIQLSIDNAFKGRIGLHSLPQAEPFYAGCGMTDLGPDPSPMAEHLRYYEMTQQQAETFLAGGYR